MHIVYLIQLKRDEFPNKYIGSKSNCSLKEGKIYDSRGKVYIGSSTDKRLKELIDSGTDYSIQIIATFDNYNDALIAERDCHLKLDVVASPEFFNKSVATISTYTNPEYATYKHNTTQKVARLPRNHEKVLSGEWVGVTKGVVLSEEERKKRASYGTDNGFFGKKHTEETKRNIGLKIGDAHRGKPKSEEQRRKMAEARRNWWIARKKREESGQEEGV